MTAIRLTRTEREGGLVAEIVLDGPARANALGTPALVALTDAFRGLAGEDRLRVAVLSASGARAFCGGADVTEMARFDAVTGQAFIERLHGVCDAIRALPVPVVARIQGACLGAALEIAAACDLRVASTAARFAMPEVLIGIPSVIEAALLPRLVGWGMTADLVYTGEAIDADAALSAGLVQRLAPPEGLDAAVARVVDAILAAGPAAIRQQKALMRVWERSSLDDAVVAGIAAFAESWKGDEPRRMMDAFLAARARAKG